MIIRFLVKSFSVTFFSQKSTLKSFAQTPNFSSEYFGVIQDFVTCQIELRIYEEHKGIFQNVVA